MGGGQGPCGVTRGSQGDRISPARDTGGTGSVPAGPGTAVRRTPPPHLPSPILQPAMCVPLQSAHRACTPQNSVAGRKTLISLQKSKNQPQESHRIPELGTALHRVGLGTLSPPPRCITAVTSGVTGGVTRAQARRRGRPSAPRRCWLGSSTSWGPGPGCGAKDGLGAARARSWHRGAPLPAGTPPTSGLWGSSGPHGPQKATPLVTPVGTCLGTGSCAPLGTGMGSHTPPQRPGRQVPLPHAYPLPAPYLGVQDVPDSPRHRLCHHGHEQLLRQRGRANRQPPHEPAAWRSAQSRAPLPSRSFPPSKKWDWPYWSPLAAGGKLRLTTSTNSATVSASVKMTALGPASKV